MPFLRSSTVEPYRKRSRTGFRSSREPEYLKWSKSSKFRVPKKSDPNSILRVVILNPQYKINTETLHYLFSQYSTVVRIVLFQKDGLPNGMIEFDSIEGASRARDYLNGFEMYYGGANRLQIEFAWTPKLFVTTNDINKSWDYTINSGGYFQPMLPQQTSYYYDQGYQFTQSQPVYSDDFNNNLTMPQNQKIQVQNQTMQPMINFSAHPVFQPNTMFVSGLNYEMSSTDMLFNLLSLYGNVAKIQFLANLQGTAIIQMFDSLSVDTCVRYLNNVPIGSYGRLQVYWADPNYYPTNLNQFKLPDGSGNFKSFIDSKNQRFLIPRPSFWIQPPSKIVRYYNTPASLTEENIMAILKNKPKQVRALKMPADEECGASRGLLEFASVSQAVLAVMMFNNKEIRTNAKTVHFMKLCFSSSQSLDLKN